MALSRLRSVTSRFNFAFSSSSWRKRRNSRRHQSAEFFLPVESCLADSELATDLFDLRTQLGLLQCKCDLLFRLLVFMA
ncbi:hypothetical protein WJ62_16695 [Burkholderia diffusa]|nr:hypothetical protein WJ62_16695 [Burkholderia diffusa]